MRKRRNEPERKLADLAELKGWIPSKRGWPDFMCTNPETGEMIAVECKPRIGPGKRHKYLRREQVQCMDYLTNKGIRCFVSDGETLEPYHREKHRPRTK